MNTTLAPKNIKRILVLGGGFGGIYTAYHLQKEFASDASVEITLVSRNNYFLMTPLLFEAGTGVLEPRHAVNPIRPMFKKARFVEANVERIDFETRRVFARHAPDNFIYELDYDHLVLALGGVTNLKLIPGSEHALPFKTLGDAIYLRNRIIDLFEQADVEEDTNRRRELLTTVIVGGGLVGIELMGELTEFVESLLRSYPRIPRNVPRFVLIEAAKRILPEMEEDLAAYAAKTLQHRGVEIYTDTKVAKIEPEQVFLPPLDGGIRAGAGREQVIHAKSIMLCAGVVANPLVNDLPLQKARNGRIVVEASMRSRERPEIWALGDCAAIPDKNGKPYPPLAQHALREARTLAKNIATVVRAQQRGDKEPPKLQPFEYQTLGMLASLGHYSGVGRVTSFKIRGFLAWWVWRTYYVMQMTRWERRLRVILDWTVALLFRNDIVKLDLFGAEHPTESNPKETIAPNEHLEHIH
ncbi:MAG: NAD(P)/FAD-dependent oxidoreductase [Phycisphaerae bacterium]